MFRNPYADGLIILVIVLLFFGPKRLPSLARSIGESMKEFRHSIGSHDEEERSEITQAAATPTAAAPGTPVPQATAPAAPPTPSEPTAATASPTPASSPADRAS
jgi:sec-independent protein translocase protein TatA